MVDAVRAGNYLEVAAAYAGVPKSTFYLWLKRGRAEAEGVFADFAQAVEEALAAAEAQAVALITKAAAKEWQAAAWRLERKSPKRWGRKSRADEARVALLETQLGILQHKLKALEQRAGQGLTPVLQEGAFAPHGGPGVGPCGLYHTALDPAQYPDGPLVRALAGTPKGPCPVCGGEATPLPAPKRKEP